MSFLDTALTILIILSLILIAASKITKQSIPDMVRGIGEYIGERREEVGDKYLELNY